MNGDDVVEPRERLVEVLLEEALGSRPASAPGRTFAAPRTRWLAAAVVLLGAGVVVATALLRRPGAEGVAPAQDPVPPPPARAVVNPEPFVVDFHELQITSQAEWDAVLPRITAVNCWLLRAGTRALAGTERAAATVRYTGAQAMKLAKLVPPVGTNAFDVDRAEAPPFDAWLAFEVGDKRVHAFVRLHDQPTLVLGRRRAASLPEALQRELVTMVVAAGRRLQVAHGMVSSLDELADVPADAKAIRCPPPPNGSLERHLGRFRELEHLEFVITTNLGAGQPISIPLPELPTTLFDEMKALPQLRHLRCNGALLNSDERVRELVALPQLRSLRLDGMTAGVLGGTLGVRMGGATVDGMRLLARRIEKLELVDCEVPAALLEPWLEVAQLRRLVLFGDAMPPELLARFARLPTLAELGLGGVAWTDAHLQALDGSRVTVLRLEHTEVTTTALRRLPRSLRRLDLRRQKFAESPFRMLETYLPDCNILRPGDADPDDADPFAGFAGAKRR
jgi:hypothetical protein